MRYLHAIEYDFDKQDLMYTNEIESLSIFNSYIVPAFASVVGFNERFDEYRVQPHEVCTCM